MNRRPIEFSPAMPIPPTFDVPARIKQLEDYLDSSSPNYQPKGQHTNIRAAIQLYNEGTIDGLTFVVIVNGKISTREEAFKYNGWMWTEVCFT